MWISKPRIAWFFFVATLSLFGYRSWKDIHHYSGIDLWARVTSARAQNMGLNPYFFKQDNNTIAKLSDPGRLGSEITRFTYPPTLLTFYKIGVESDYSVIRRYWFFIEWTLFLLTVFLCIRMVPPSNNRSLFIAFISVFFLGSYFWRLHVERGQYYIWISFLWSVAAYLGLVRSKMLAKNEASLNNFTIGLVLGLASAIRPTHTPFLFLGASRFHKHGIFGFCAGLLGLVLLTFYQFGLSRWLDFYRLAEHYSINSINQNHLTEFFGKPPAVSPIIEGGVLHYPMASMSLNSGLKSHLFNFFSSISANGDMITQYGLALLALGCILLGAIIFYKKPTIDQIFITIFTLAYFSDFLLSPYRFGYADVLILPVFTLLFHSPISSYLAKISLGFVVTGLILGHSLSERLSLFNGEHATIIREVLVSVGLMILIGNWIGAKGNTST